MNTQKDVALWSNCRYFDTSHQTNKPRSSRGLVIFDTLWQFFVIVFGWIGRIEKILSNNERQIINFKANFVDETVISGISGHE